MVTLSRLLGLAAGFFFGIIVHEYAHAKASDMLGDKYPRMQGRLKLNPKAHADPMGTLALPAVFMLIGLVGQLGPPPFRMVFGYGKPMQTNSRSLRKPKRDQILVALAGPAVNLALAAIGGIAGSRLTDQPLRALLAPSGATDVAAAALLYMMTVNVFILIVNVLPIPSLDGAKVLSVFVSPKVQLTIQEYGQYILLFVLLLFFFLQGVLTAMANPVCRVLTAQAIPICPL